MRLSFKTDLKKCIMAYSTNLYNLWSNMEDYIHKIVFMIIMGKLQDWWDEYQCQMTKA